MEDQFKDILTRLTNLEDAIFGDQRQLNDGEKAIGRSKCDFSLNERAFVKRYFLKFNGQETFALICSFLSKGETDLPIDLAAVKKLWKNCQGVIGYPFSSMYSTRAKERGWVTPAKKGAYSLQPSWIEIFN